MRGQIGFLIPGTLCLVILAVAEVGTAADLDEVIVNARRRPEALARTPVAVTAVSSETINRSVFLDLVDIQRRAPGLQATHSASGSGRAAHLFIRGIGQLDFITTTEPGVGTYLDGVYLGRMAGAALDLEDVERVEVLRGPQGAIWGKNSIGGAVAVYTRQPDESDELGITIRAGNLDRFEASGNFNHVLVPGSLALRGGLKLIKSDGYSRRLVDGIEVGDNNDLLATLKVRYQNDNGLTVTTAFDGLRRDAHVTANAMVGFVPTPLSEQYSQYIGVIDGRYIQLEPGVTWSGVEPLDKLDQWGLATTVDWQQGSWALRSITSFRTLEQDTAGDFDGTPFPFLEQETAIDQDQVTQEVQVTGDLVDHRLQVLAGVFLMREQVTWDQYGDFARGLYAFTGIDSTVNQFWDIETRTAAGFGTLSWAATDRLSIFGGLRWTWETKDFVTRHRHLESGEVFIPRTDLSARLSEPSWSLGLSLDWPAATLTYFTVGSGFRSGGYNGRPFSPDELLPYGPESVVSYEVGLKSSFAADRLQVNLSLFYNDYNDIQLTGVDANASGGLRVFVANVAGARIHGGELETSWQVTPNFSLNSAISVLSNRFTDIGAEAAITGHDRLPQAPDWTAYLEGVVTVPASFGHLEVAVSGYAVSSHFHLVPNSFREEEDGYHLLDARLTYLPAGEAWSVSLYGTNLTDEVYRAFGQDSTASFGVAAGWFGRPREYGIEWRWRK